MTLSRNYPGVAYAAVAAIAAASGAASAQTIYGGGATLPAPAYVGPIQAVSANRLTDGFSTPDDSASLFGAYSAVPGNPMVSYCQTGSGAGKDVLYNFTGFVASNACGLFTGTPMGFSAPSGQVLPDFAASDSPFNAADLTNFYAAPSAAARTGPVEVPSVAGAIAIVLNNSDTAVPTTPNITTDQLCSVFAGTLTNWNQLGSYASKAIKVIYRSDGSGTSFSFSNHLAAVCNTTSTIFQTNQMWSGGVLPSGTAAAPFPADETGFSGNPGVVSQVDLTDGSIAYAEYADGHQIEPALRYFTVDSKDPVADLSPTVGVSFTTGMIIAAVNNTNGTPALQPVSDVTSSDGVPQCLLLVDPKSYSNPSGYPIIAVTYLLAYNSGNPQAAAVGNLLEAPYDSGIRTAAAADINPSKGYAWLSLSPALATTTITGCVN